MGEPATEMYVMDSATASRGSDLELKKAIALKSCHNSRQQYWVPNNI